MSENKLDSAINKGLQNAKDALAEKMMHMAHKESVQIPVQTSYNVIFTGTFTKDEKLVIAAMAKFFKQGQEATKRLLKAGRVVKSFPDKGPADKLAKMLSGIGLSCKVEMETTGGDQEREGETLLEKAAFKLADSKTPEVKIPPLSRLGWKHWLAIGVSSAILVGIGVGLWLKPPVVKGDSFDSYKASVQKVIDHAPVEKQAAIRKAVDTLTGAGFQFHDSNTFGGSEEVAAGVVFSEIDGLNADEILAAAEVDMEKRRQLFRDEIASLKKEIAAEQAVIAELEKSNDKLRQLSISEEKFTWTRGAPEMSARITNNSDTAITRILFQGYLYNNKNQLLVTQPLSFTAIGIRAGSYGYAFFTPAADSPWASEEAQRDWQNVRFSLTIENAIDSKGEDVGIDVRPNRKKIADLEKRVGELDKQLANIKL